MRSQIKGYPGLANMCEIISDIIPPASIFVEPFCGLGRVSYQMILKHKVHPENVFLSDLSEVSIEFCKQHFPSSNVLKQDFKVLILKFKDNPNATMLIDPPWYNNGPNVPRFNRHYHIDHKVNEYYQICFDLLKNCKCKVIFVSNRNELFNEKAIEKSNYISFNLFHPTRVIFGRPASCKVGINFNEKGELVTKHSK